MLHYELLFAILEPSALYQDTPLWSYMMMQFINEIYNFTYKNKMIH